MDNLNALISTFLSAVSSKFLPAIIELVIGLLVIRVIMSLVNATLEKSRLEKAAHSLIRTLTKIVLDVLLGFIVADTLGIDVTGVIALSTVATLAVSLATQNALSNVVGGFTLLSTHPFASGDYVEIAGQSGTVQEVGIAYTKLATPDNKTVSLPNSAVIASQIVNYSTAGTRRVEITVGVSYDSDPETVKAALLRAANVPTAMFTPAPFAGLRNYGDSAIEFVLQVWTSSDDYWTTLYAVNENISVQFAEDGIEITYPHLNVHLDQK